jgi:apoptosis-inducing factor 2
LPTPSDEIGPESDSPIVLLQKENEDLIAHLEMWHSELELTSGEVQRLSEVATALEWSIDGIAGNDDTPEQKKSNATLLLQLSPLRDSHDVLDERMLSRKLGFVRVSCLGGADYSSKMTEWSSLLKTHGISHPKCAQFLRSNAFPLECRGEGWKRLVPDRLALSWDLFRFYTWSSNKLIIAINSDMMTLSQSSDTPTPPSVSDSADKVLAAETMIQAALPFMHNFRDQDVFYEDLRCIVRVHILFRPDLALHPSLCTTAATLLLFLDAYSAWVCLEALVSQPLFGSLLCGDMSLLSGYVRAFELLIFEQLPTIYEVLQSIDLSAEAYAIKWFRTLFADILSPRLNWHLWDIALSSSCSVFFSAGLALLETHDKELRSASFEDAVHILTCRPLPPLKEKNFLDSVSSHAFSDADLQALLNRAVVVELDEDYMDPSLAVVGGGAISTEKEKILVWKGLPYSGTIIYDKLHLIARDSADSPSAVNVVFDISSCDVSVSAQNPVVVCLAASSLEGEKEPIELLCPSAASAMQWMARIQRVQETKIQSAPLYHVAERRRVVVVGGGFGGTEVAKTLQHDFEVLLVDIKDYFEYTPSILRTLTEPVSFSSCHVKHGNYLNRGQFVLGCAARVEAHELILSSGTTIPFDYCVLACGSSYGSGIKSDVAVMNLRGVELRAVHSKMKHSRSILIVGGGLVGVELAGELICKYPRKLITLITRGDRLASRSPLKASRFMERYLQSLGVHVMTATQVKQVEGNRYECTNGQVVMADLCFSCVGVTPNSQWMTACPLVELEGDQNSVAVKPTLQLRSCETVFALGDLIEVDSERLAQNARIHGETVVDNIRRLNASKEPRPYTPKARPNVVSLGPDMGVFMYKSFWWHGKSALKIKDFAQWRTLRGLR